jgi:5-methylthioadenosine/S-adenosylhomocysteine deaminase
VSTRQPADLLIEARWVLPIAPANVALAEHALAVSAGRILAVGPAAELRERFEAREHVVRSGHVLLPGLVNAHTHACHALLRGLPVRGPRSAWLREILAPVEQRCLSADFVRDGTRLALAEMLRAGITCFADLSLHPEEAARVAAAAHVRAAIALPVSEAPTAWAESATAHLARAERLWDEYRSDPRIALYFAPLVSHGAGEALLTRVRRVADELDARIALHLEEFAALTPHAGPGPQGAPAAPALPPSGVEDSARAPPGSRWLRQLKALGLLRPGFTAIGATVCDEADLELLSRHGASVVTCPQADLRLGARVPVVAPDPDRGALGTDSPAAAGALDLLGEARTAALVCGVDAAQALRMATLGAAAALGLASRIGSLEPGKAADLACIDLGALAAAPASGVHDALVFGAARGAVSDVWTAGRAALCAGRLVALDEEELTALPARWAERIGMEAAA